MKHIVLAAFAAMAILSGCASTQKDGDTVSVQLKSNPTTGSSWTAAIADSSIAVLASDTYTQDKAAKGRIGAGGVQTLTFKCLKEGSTDIILTYGRPWENGEVWETRTARLTVGKNLQGTIEMEAVAPAEE